jgi:hypothetical protein
VGKAVPYSWGDVERGSPPLLPWLRLAVCAAGHKVAGAFPWMAVLCPSWVLVRWADRAIVSPVYLILICANVIVAGILLFQFNSEHTGLWSATRYLLVGLGLFAGAGESVEVCMKRLH